MRRLLATALLGLGTVSPVVAGDVDFNVGGDSARLEFRNALPGTIDLQGGEWEIGGLYVDEVEDDADEDAFLGHVDLRATGDAGAQGLDLNAGLGLRGYYLGSDFADGGALAVAGQFTARLPDYNRVGLHGEAFFAPSATSFSDLDEIFEIGVYVDYQVIRNGFVYLGWRSIETEIDDATGGDVDLNDGAVAGLRLEL